MITTHPHTTVANAGKVEALMALFPAFRTALGGLGAMTRRELLTGQPLSSWRVMSGDTIAFDHGLSARQMKSAQNMVYASVSSWQESPVGEVRKFITGSQLPEHRKTVLYRVNARRQWWATRIELPWKPDAETGELLPCKAKEAGALWLSVDAEDLKLLRHMAKHAQRHHHYPDLGQVDTLVLDSIVARLSETKSASQAGAIGWWVQIATLTKGKPVRVPLSHNTYFDRHYAKAVAGGGGICGAIQLHLTRDQHRQPVGIGISLLLDTPDAPTRTTGIELGIDFGCGSALFATSEGRLLGGAMLCRLRELDAILEPYAANLQQRGIHLKTDPYYQQLQARITGYVTNEIGRLLNRLAARHGEQAIRDIVVEKLDFRGGGLSRRMNRILTRTGRGIIKSRLAALTAKHGITVTEVPSPFTSCECSGCGYTNKTNRKGTRFTCGFCGLRLHADVNAARVILSRRSRQTPDHTGPRSRKNTLQLLDTRHRQRWGLPIDRAVPGIAGAPEQVA
jgi:putative transposase